MDTIIMEHELDLMRADSHLSTSLNTVMINEASNRLMIAEGYFTEAEASQIQQQAKFSIMDAIKKFFKAIRDALKKMVMTIQKNIAYSINKKNLKNRLNQMKKINKLMTSDDTMKFGQGSEVLAGSKGTFYVFDYMGYIKYLDKNLQQAESLVEAIRQKAQTADKREFEIFIDDAKRKINDDYILSNDDLLETFYMEMDLTRAITYVEAMLNNYRDFFNKIEKKTEAYYNRCELALSQKIPAEHINEVKEVVNVTVQQNSRAINRFANNVVNCIKPVKNK